MIEIYSNNIYQTSINPLTTRPLFKKSLFHWCKSQLWNAITGDWLKLIAKFSIPFCSNFILFLKLCGCVFMILHVKRGIGSPAKWLVLMTSITKIFFLFYRMKPPEVSLNPDAGIPQIPGLPPGLIPPGPPPGPPPPLTPEYESEGYQVSKLFVLNTRYSKPLF